MPCMGPDLTHARRQGAEFYAVVERMLREHPAGLTIDPPDENVKWMNLHGELATLKNAIEGIFVADACNSF